MKKDRLLEYAKENDHVVNIWITSKSKIRDKLIELSIMKEKSLSFTCYLEFEAKSQQTRGTEDGNNANDIASEGKNISI